MKNYLFISIGMALTIGHNLSAATLAENLQRDSDGDNISDAVEMCLGLNPLDKSDGLSDEDQDGLRLS
jgi:hypothetical protein